MFDLYDDAGVIFDASCPTPLLSLSPGLRSFYCRLSWSSPARQNFALRLYGGARKRSRLDLSCTSPSFLQAWNIACRLRDVVRGVGAEGLSKPSLSKPLPQNCRGREVTCSPRPLVNCPTASILSRPGSRCCRMRVAHGHRRVPAHLPDYGPHRLKLYQTS